LVAITAPHRRLAPWLVGAWTLVACSLGGCANGRFVWEPPAECDDDDVAADDNSATPTDNQPPTAPVIAIEPAEPQAGEDLTCVIVEPSTDPDGDEVAYAYAWTAHGLDTNLTADTVPGAYTQQGEEWSCTVVAADGQAESPPAVATITIGVNVFEQVQSLSGGPSSVICEECEYTFDVTYTTISVEGVCSATCWVLYEDGTYPMGYSSAAGMILVYRADYYGGYVWYPWYYATLSGSHIDFVWDGYGYTSSGYWDIDGDTMTGLAINEEP